ncbi:MAG: DUF1573 domain-containing protein [Thermoguttaceae bacterium]|nr:DUF1573 domain-containing protein [Thermoguttaceae bacterium]MDW8079837.1 DUF1573 domain-containing protein [Thermoguttaceae bacterium]
MTQGRQFVVVLLAAGILGAATGFLWAASEFWLWPVVKHTHPADVASKLGTTKGEPRAVVDNPVYDFGVLDEHAKGRHEFVIRNEGTAPLRIEQGSTTCRCTTSLVNQKTVEPGQQTTVAVEFDLKGFSGPYSQSATIFTNDPRNPRIVLSVRGKVVKAIQAIPTELVFTRVPSGQQVSAEFRLVGYRPTPLEIQGYEWSDTNSARFFEVELRPISPSELRDQEGASGGVVGKLVLKPGLPLGTFNQKLRFRTNYPEAPQVELPVRGTIAAEISIVSRGWDESRSLLRLGTFKSARGFEHRFLIRVSRSLADRVAFSVAEVFPDFVQVQVEQPRPLGDAPALLVPVVLKFPKGCPAGNYLGIEGQPGGRILFKTGVPEAPELQINLSFLVESE